MITKLDLTKDNIMDIKRSLACIEDTSIQSKDALRILRNIYDPELLKYAYLKLPDENKVIIKQLTLELNSEDDLPF